MARPIQKRIDVLENQALEFEAVATTTTRTEADYSNPFDIKQPSAYYTAKAAACRATATDLRNSLIPRPRQCVECGNYIAQCICAQTN